MPRSIVLLALLVVAPVALCAAESEGGPANLVLSSTPAGPATAASVLAAARAASHIYRRHLQELDAELHIGWQPVVLQAIAATGHLVDVETLPMLLPFLESAQPPAEQIAASVALGHIGSPIAVPGLRALVVQSKDAGVRLAALNAMVQIKSAQAQDFLGRAKDPDEVISGDGLTNAGTLSFDKAAEALAGALITDRNQITRRMCAIGLGRIGDRSQGPALLDALGDADPGVRRYAAEALVKLNYTPAIPYLLMALEGNIASSHINQCLMLLSNQDFGYDWRDNEVARHDAVERGFRWWTDHAAELSK